MSKRNKIIIVLIAGVAIIGAVLTFLFWQQITHFFMPTTPSDDSSQDGGMSASDREKMVLYQARQERYDEAEKAASEKGPEAGQQVLDTKLETQQDASERASIYMQKAILAESPQGGTDRTAAITYAYQAEAEQPTYGSALYVAELEYYYGNKTNALKYYKLYLERVTPEATDLNPGDKEMVQAKIAELEGAS